MSRDDAIYILKSPRGKRGMAGCEHEYRAHWNSYGWEDDEVIERTFADKSMPVFRSELAVIEYAEWLDEDCSCTEYGIITIESDIPLGDVLKAAPEPIKVWRFHDAPAELRALSPHCGDEDWVIVVPPGCDYGDLIDDKLTVCSSDNVGLDDGSTCIITCHA